MAMIVVISVMNGFEEDIQAKLLGTQAHIIISNYSGGIDDPQAIMSTAEQDHDVLGATPYLFSEGLISHAGSVSGVMIRGIDKETAPRVIQLADNITEGSLEELDNSGVILGQELARRSGISLGDTITLISPSGTVTPLGMLPRSGSYIVQGFFSTGMYEFDSRIAYTTLEAAMSLLSKERPDGIRLKITDIYKADQVGQRLMKSLPYGHWARTWKDINRSLYAALKMEKTVLGIIMVFIIMVAAFNIVSTLIMLVMEKRKDIAILKSMGATTAQVLRIFIASGMAIGLTGTALGVLCGVALANNLDPVVAAVEFIFRVEVMPKDVYYITGLPTKVVPFEVGMIAAGALLLSFISTIYPARQAAHQDPVEVMRYDG